MAFFEEADIDGMLADSGVDVTLGMITVKGLLDLQDEILLEQKLVGVIGRTVAVTLKTGALPTLKAGSEVVVDKISYNVRERRQIGDGALTTILCTKD